METELKSKDLIINKIINNNNKMEMKINDNINNNNNNNIFEIDYINNLYYLPNNKINKINKNKININFKNNNINRYGHYSSLLLIKPILNNIINNNNNNNKNIKLKLIKNNCNYYCFKNGGYSFSFGIIYLLKSLLIKNNNLLKQFELKLKNIKKFKNDSCSLYNIFESDEIFKHFKTFYITFGCLTDENPNRYFCKFGKDSKYNYESIYNSSKDNICNLYNLSNNDKIIFVNIFNNSELSYSINNKPIGLNISTNDNFIKNGKIKLDFNKYIYYISLSSSRCNCENCDGFEFEIEV